MVRIAHDRTYINQLIAQHQAIKSNANEEMSRAQSDAWFAQNSACRAQYRIAQMQGEIAEKQTDMVSWASLIASQQQRNMQNLQAYFQSFLGTAQAQKDALENQLAARKAELATIMDNLNTKLNTTAANILPDINAYAASSFETNSCEIDRLQQKISTGNFTNTSLSALIAKKARLTEKSNALKDIQTISGEALKPENQNNSILYLSRSSLKLASLAQKEFIQKYRAKYNCSQEQARQALPKAPKLNIDQKAARHMKTVSAGSRTAEPQNIYASLAGQYIRSAAALNRYFATVKASVTEGLIDDEAMNLHKPHFERFEAQFAQDQKAIKEMDKTLQQLEQAIENVDSRQASVQYVHDRVKKIQAVVNRHATRTSDILDSLDTFLNSHTKAYENETRGHKAFINKLHSHSENNKRLFNDSDHKLTTFKALVNKETEKVDNKKNNAEDHADEIKGDLETLSSHADHSLMIPLSYTGLRSNPFFERKRRFMHTVTFKGDILKKQTALEKMNSSQQSQSFCKLKTNLSSEIGRTVAKTHPQHLRFRPMHNPPEPGQNLSSYADKFERINFKGRNYIRHSLDAYDEQYRRL